MSASYETGPRVAWAVSWAESGHAETRGEGQWIVRSAMTITRMLTIILLAGSVHGSNTETSQPSQTSDSAIYNKILSSMDISREVRKVFTSLWATPEVKVSLEQDLIFPDTWEWLRSTCRPLSGAAPVSGAACLCSAWSTSLWSTSRGTLSPRMSRRRWRELCPEHWTPPSPDSPHPGVRSRIISS